MVEMRTDDDVFVGERGVTAAEQRDDVLRRQLGGKSRVRRGRRAGDERLEVFPIATDLERAVRARAAVREGRQVERAEAARDVCGGAVVARGAGPAPFERVARQMLDDAPDGDGEGGAAGIGPDGWGRRVAGGKRQKRKRESEN